MASTPGDIREPSNERQFKVIVENSSELAQGVCNVSAHH
jgi:hypothetical protein